MLSHLPRILLFALVTLIIWVMVLGWWQATNHQPKTAETALYLIALPLALIVGFYVLTRFVHYLRAPAVVASTAAPATQAAVETPSQPVLPKLMVVSSALIAATGDHANAVADAAKAGRRPSIDKAMTDDEGFPLFLARVPDLAIASKVDFPYADDARFITLTTASSEQARALALLSQTLENFIGQLQSTLDNSPTPAIIPVLWLQPDSWSHAAADVLEAWLMQNLSDQWPEQVFELTQKIVTTDADGLAALNKLPQPQSSDEQQCPVIVLAAVSHIGERTIRHWQTGGQLFTASEHGGQIPGEAAVALAVTPLIGTTTPPPDPTDETAPLVIRPVSLAQQEGDDNNSEENALKALIEAQLAQNSDSQKVKAVVADTDQRLPGQQELLTCITALLPKLDPIKDCITSGAVCGNVQPFGGLLAVACAIDLAQDSQTVLCASNQHHKLRAVTTIEPLNLSAAEPTGNA